MSRHVRSQDVMELMREQEREWPARELGLRLSGVPLGFDAHKNLAYSVVATAPSPASSGTSLVVQAADGVKFPAVPFNATVWPTLSNPTTQNAEIVRVTARTTDTLTITRAQEGSAARTVVVGDQIAATSTLKLFTDIEAFLPYTTAGDLAYASSATAAARLAMGSAGAVLRTDGTTPSWGGSATVATTVSGLGTAIDGKIGLLRCGSTPYEFVQVIYDATRAKWVTPDLDVAFQPGTLATQAVSASYVDLEGGASLNGAIAVNYKNKAAASLSLLVWCAAWIQPSVADGAFDLRVAVYSYNNNTTAGAGSSATGATNFAFTGTGVGNRPLIMAWSTVTPSVTGDICVLDVEGRKATGTGTWSQGKWGNMKGYRWEG